MTTIWGTADNATTIASIPGLEEDLVLKDKLCYNEMPTPATPPAGQLCMYAKADKQFYQLNSLGVETMITTGGATQDGWLFSTAAGVPVAGDLNFDGVTPSAAVTTINVHIMSTSGKNHSVLFEALSAHDHVFICDDQNCKIYDIVSKVNNTTWWAFEVILQSENDTASFADNDPLQVEFLIQSSTLQESYNLSSNPHIETSVAAGGGFTVKRGTGADADVVLAVTDGSDAQNFTVSGAGLLDSKLITQDGVPVLTSTGSTTSTGLISGGLITQTGPTSVSVTAGTGVINYNGTITQVAFAGGAPAGLVNPVYFISIDDTGALIINSISPSPEIRRQRIFLGVVALAGGVIVDVLNLPMPLYNMGQQMYDAFVSLGIFNVSGNIFTGNVGGNLSLDKSSGVQFEIGANTQVSQNDPHNVVQVGLVVPSFQYFTQVGVVGSPVTAIDPNSYDVGGVVTAIGGGPNQWTLQRVYMTTNNVLLVEFARRWKSATRRRVQLPHR